MYEAKSERSSFLHLTKRKIVKEQKLKAAQLVLAKKR